MSNVVSLAAYRERKPDPAYLADLRGMDKQELLEEMVKYQEAKSQGIVQHAGNSIALFERLNAVAETPELRVLTGSLLASLRQQGA